MLKLNSTINRRVLFHLSLVLAFISSLLLADRPTYGQSNVQLARANIEVKRNQAPQEVLPARLGNVWRAVGESRIMSADEFSIVQDANVYLEYGMQSLTTRIYTDGKTQFVIEAFEMRYPSGAYGLCTFNRGLLPSNRREFSIGRYLISIFGPQNATLLEKAPIDDLILNLRQRLSDGPVELSPLPSHLPDQDKIAGSEKYLVGPIALARLAAFSDLKDVISFTGGAEAATADYSNGGGRMSLAIIEYPTPQLASTGYAQLKSHFDILSPQEKEHRQVKRIGNYIVEAVNVKDAAAAQTIIGQIKYTARIYWQGERLSNIPLPFRPPDKTALEEAARTAKFLVITFYAIGLMIVGAALLGVFAGGFIFYWRRYRRRKLGLDETFSDAGGTIRLNLDDYLLSAGKSQIELLGKSD